MRRSAHNRKNVNLSQSIQHQLNMYALAAGATGVTALCSAQAAHAKIVYTVAHRKIPVNGQVLLDLNHDGIPDFRLNNGYSYGSGEPGGAVWVVPKRRANKVLAAEHCTSDSVQLCAAALPKGAKIGPKGRFLPGYPEGEIMAASDIHGYRTGSWFDVTRYVGLKFVIKGTIHFGWARVRVSAPKNFKFGATLLGYAYETISNRPIIAGRTTGTGDSNAMPGTLGSLALGRK